MRCNDWMYTGQSQEAVLRMTHGITQVLSATLDCCNHRDADRRMACRVYALLKDADLKSLRLFLCAHGFPSFSDDLIECFESALDRVWDEYGAGLEKDLSHWPADPMRRGEATFKFGKDRLEKDDLEDLLAEAYSMLLLNRHHVPVIKPDVEFVEKLQRALGSHVALQSVLRAIAIIGGTVLEDLKHSSAATVASAEPSGT